MSNTNSIQALREARGWSRPRLGELMGTSGQQVERLEKGQRRLTQDWIRKAAQALGVTDAEILTGTSSSPTARTAQAVVVASGDSNAVQIRRFDISYAMGPGTNIDDYIEEEPFEVDAGWLSTITRSPPERLGVARGAGDSMFPTLLDSDLIIFDTTQRILNLQDRIWVCSINGAGAIKRLRPLAKGRIEVISDNPTHGNYEVDADDVFLLGRVLASIRKH